MSQLDRDRTSTTGNGPTMKASRASRSKAVSTPRTGLSRPHDAAVEVLVAIGMELVIIYKVVSSRSTALVDSRA